MNPSTPPPSPRPHGVSLYLRDDGTVLIVKGEAAIEIGLTPAQLVQFGTDALRLAVKLDPLLIEAAAQALSSTEILFEVPA